MLRKLVVKSGATGSHRFSLRLLIVLLYQKAETKVVSAVHLLETAMGRSTNQLSSAEQGSQYQRAHTKSSWVMMEYYVTHTWCHWDRSQTQAEFYRCPHIERPRQLWESVSPLVSVFVLVPLSLSLSMSLAVCLLVGYKHRKGPTKKQDCRCMHKR